MHYLSILLIAIGLAMDAFAVSLAKGISLKKINYTLSFKISFLFGLFQGIMTLIGWFIGSDLLFYFHKYKIIVLIILVGIGLNMIREALKNEESDVDSLFSMKVLIPLAIATSIDALVTGISLSFLSISITVSVILISVITLVLCFIAVILGTVMGNKINSKFAEVFGGIILIALGIFSYFK